MRQTLISDTNVRVAAASPALQRRRARRSILARLLLNQPPALLLLALLQPMFACVIPVAPDFQDPLAAANSPPYPHDPSPKFGETRSIIRTASSDQHTLFSVQITDLNTNDTLYVRWLLNNPPMSGTTTALLKPEQSNPPATGSTHDFEATFDMFCGIVINTSVSAGVPQHFSMVVSDRDWQPGGAEDQAMPGGNSVAIEWTLIFQCNDGTTP